MIKSMLVLALLHCHTLGNLQVNKVWWSTSGECSVIQHEKGGSCVPCNLSTRRIYQTVTNRSCHKFFHLYFPNIKGWVGILCELPPDTSSPVLCSVQSCSGTCPVRLRISPRMEITQLLQTSWRQFPLNRWRYT